MSLSPSNSAQPVPCLNSGSATSHSSSGAAGQVSEGGCRGRCLEILENLFLIQRLSTCCEEK